MSELAMRAFRRILLIKPSSPGDIIHALPVLHGLRVRYPEAHIAWLVATPFADLIEADPALSEVIRFDRKRFGKLGRSVQVTAEFTSFVRDLRAKEFDLVIDLQGLFRSGFLALACGAETRIGFADARELAHLFYNHKIPKVHPKDTHAATKNYAVAKMLGFADVPMDFSIHLRDEDRMTAGALLQRAGISHGRDYAVLVPATRWETKCWPAERFGHVAAALRERSGMSSILVGGPTDVAVGDIAAAASGGAAVNLCGATTLRQLAALIEKAAIVVTADSTPMHVAAAFGRPLVALFGPTNPARTGPFNRLEDVVRLDLPCSPCYFRRLSQCPFNLKCMRELSVELVLERIGSTLYSSATGTAP
jgi:heptosyltransferase-1